MSVTRSKEDIMHMITSSEAYTIFAYFTTEDVYSGSAKIDNLTKYLLSWMIRGWFG